MKVKKPVKTALLLILFAVCLNAAVNHLDVVGRSLAHFFGLLSPILIGFLMAFLLSIPVNALEKRIIRPHGKRALRLQKALQRPVSIILSVLMIVGVVGFISYILNLRIGWRRKIFGAGNGIGSLTQNRPEYSFFMLSSILLSYSMVIYTQGASKMSIGNMNDDYTFYEGFEGEPEVVISLPEDEQKALHVWEGYMEDLFSNPSLEGKGWQGFTRDIHQFEGAFSKEGSGAMIDPDEYLADIMNYADAELRYPETVDVKNAIIDLLTHAIAINGKVCVDRSE